MYLDKIPWVGEVTHLDADWNPLPQTTHSKCSKFALIEVMGSKRLCLEPLIITNHKKTDKRTLVLQKKVRCHGNPTVVCTYPDLGGSVNT